jgi:hypothetical protein
LGSGKGIGILVRILVGLETAELGGGEIGSQVGDGKRWAWFHENICTILLRILLYLLYLDIILYRLIF